MMQQPPLVTIAVPCLDEAAHIGACLRSILGQDYPADRIEVIIADGGSRDETRAIIARTAGGDARVRVIENPARIQASGLNAIIRESRGDVLVRMDVHCEYDPSYVRRCVEVLERTGADNVGGAQRPVTKSWFQRALGAALGSPLGVGGARYRSADGEGFTDTVFLGAFRRRVYETVGLYDPGAVTNEDAELNQRILEAGGRIYLSRDIVAHYHPRDSFAKLARQYRAYGVGRARTMLKHRGLPVLRPVVPFLFVMAGATLVATSPFQPFTPVAFGLYAALTGAEALRVARRVPASTLAVWSIFPVMHVSHGLGFAAGLVRYLRRPDWEEPSRLAPRADVPGESEAAALLGEAGAAYS